MDKEAWRKTADMKKLRHCHPMYSELVLTVWNSLALKVRDPSLSLTQFCPQLKSVMFSTAQ